MLKKIKVPCIKKSILKQESSRDLSCARNVAETAIIYYTGTCTVCCKMQPIVGMVFASDRSLDV